jgi:hypothetical protein
MNQTFQLHRFGLLLKLHLSEHLKSYLLGTGVLFGIWLIMLLPASAKISVFHESVYRNHATLFYVIFCGAGAWFASESFRMVSTPVRGIPFLALPASQLEKFLVAFLLLLCFVPVFLGIFYLSEAICFSFINARLSPTSPRYELLDVLGPHTDPVLRYLGLVTPSFFLVGSIYFAKVPFVKTGFIAFVLLFLVLVFFNDFLLRQLLPGHDQYGSTPFREATFLENRRWYRVELKGTVYLIVNTLLLLAPPALWYIAYVRFKEKEL